MQHIDPQQQSPNDNYKMLTSLVVPRPIAWVSSQNDTGLINLAPFSFFNVVDSEPLYILLSIAQHENGRAKDTARNIMTQGEFVVNLVTEDLADAMNQSASNYPAHESELTAVGLTAAPSVKIRVPRVAEAKASLECRLHSSQALGGCTLFIGEVVSFAIADELLDANQHVKLFAPVARMGSPAFYCRTRDVFEMPKVPYPKK